MRRHPVTRWRAMHKQAPHSASSSWTPRRPTRAHPRPRRLPRRHHPAIVARVPCESWLLASGKQKMCLSAHLRVLETRVVSQGKPLCLQRYTAVTHDQHVLRHMSGSGHRGCVLIPFVSWDTPLCLMTVAMSQDGLVCLETTQCLGTSLSVS